jgi:hypothetical protein
MKLLLFVLTLSAFTLAKEDFRMFGEPQFPKYETDSDDSKPHWYDFNMPSITEPKLPKIPSMDEIIDKILPDTKDMDVDDLINSPYNLKKLQECAFRHPRECGKKIRGVICQDHKCPKNDDVIACLPDQGYHDFIKDICSGIMPWAKISTADSKEKEEERVIHKDNGINQ